jgi:hypothetical protein
MRRALGMLERDSGDRRHVRILPFLIMSGRKSQLGEAGDGGFAELLGPGLPILSYSPLELGKIREVELLRRFSHGANLPS